MSDNGTPSQPFPIYNAQQRFRRPTASPLKLVTIGFSAIALLLALAGIVWGAAVLVSGKADVEDVDRLRDQQHQTHTEVKVIQSEQRMLIRAIRPDLPIGKE